MVYDVLIVGAGVIGCAIAREISRYQLKVLVLERGADVASGTSKANSGIIHAGYDAPPGSLMAKLNIAGARLIPGLCQELRVPYRQTGSLVVAGKGEVDQVKLQRLLQQGIANGVSGLQILPRGQLNHLVPLLNSNVELGLHAPTAGVVAPYELTIALAENAAQNGVEFLLEKTVTGITKGPDWLSVQCEGELFPARLVVNAAGVHADLIAALIDDRSFSIVPCKGQELILDKRCGDMTKLVVFPLPSPTSKGVVVAPTPAGNLLIGPTAEPDCDRADTITTRSGQQQVLDAARTLIPALSIKGVITSYAGLRAVADTGDFIIRFSEDCPRLLHVAGIKSPGLSAAPAIAEAVRNLIGERLLLKESPLFQPQRDVSPSRRNLELTDWHELIKTNPAYGRIICRCEQVSEGAIRDALRSPLPPGTIDGLKRRLRVGMGRCQGGFCLPHLISLFAEYTQLDPRSITKQGAGSEYVSGSLKEKLTGGEHGE